MGQIITFPHQPTPYPDHAADLDMVKCVPPIAMRSRTDPHEAGEDPIPGLFSAPDTADAPDAAFSIDGLMMAAAQDATRQGDVRCVPCPRMPLDETLVLSSSDLARAGESRFAERALRTTLLSAQGADCAIGPLECPGALFIRARLYLARRRSPDYPAEPLNGPHVSSPPRGTH
jgi:hypothetical protein